jgi:hypothetical protein
MQKNIKLKTAPKKVRSQAAMASWLTRKSASYRAKKSESASKEALSQWAAKNGWRVVFFEGRTGAPRTGIIDALLTRIAPRQPDVLQIRLVQLKSGSAGLTPGELKRLKTAVARLETSWCFVGFDGQDLHWSGELSQVSEKVGE